jgi:hypothetical protein
MQKPSGVHRLSAMKLIGPIGWDGGNTLCTVYGVVLAPLEEIAWQRCRMPSSGISIRPATREFWMSDRPRGDRGTSGFG